MYLVIEVGGRLSKNLLFITLDDCYANSYFLMKSLCSLLQNFVLFFHFEVVFVS